MAQLPNFPFKNQLNEPIIDGLPDQNANENCLPTCIAAGLQYELGGKEYTGSEVEHKVYGSNYHGGTSAVEYVAYVQSQGCSLVAESGSPAYLTQRIHYHLQHGRPVIGTIPSCYCPPQNRLDPGSSHCIIFYKESAGVLIAMNPWQAISQGNTDAWWGARLCYDQIWIMDKKGNTTLGIPQGWKDDGKTLTAPNGFHCVMGFRQWVLAHDWHPENLPLENEHASVGGGTQQVFRMAGLAWNAKQGVFGIPLGVLLKEAEDSEALLEKEIASLKAAPPPTPPPTPKPAPDIAKQLTSIADSIQNLIDAL